MEMRTVVLCKTCFLLNIFAKERAGERTYAYCFVVISEFVLSFCRGSLFSSYS